MTNRWSLERWTEPKATITNVLFWIRGSFVSPMSYWSHFGDNRLLNILILFIFQYLFQQGSRSFDILTLFFFFFFLVFLFFSFLITYIIMFCLFLCLWWLCPPNRHVLQVLDLRWWLQCFWNRHPSKRTGRRTRSKTPSTFKMASITSHLHTTAAAAAARRSQRTDSISVLEREILELVDTSR